MEVCGLNIKLELKEKWAQIHKAPVDEGRGVINWSSAAAYPDPIAQLYRMFGPDGFFQQAGYWKNDEFNAYGKTLETIDTAARREAVAKMLEIFEDDPPATYLHVTPMFYGKASSISWVPSGTAFMDLRAGSLKVE